MKDDAKKFLYKLLETPSPSGFEQPIQRVVKERLKGVAESIEIDLHGNLIAGINLKASRKVMLAGHCDQIGFMVKHISKDGFVYLGAIGGIDAGVLPGASACIWNEKGMVRGVFGRKPIHLQSADERSKMTLDMEKVWIDIGAKDGKEAEKKIKVGDPVTFGLAVQELMGDKIAAPGIDNKVGLFIAVEALRKAKAMKLDVALYSVSTVQEELGLRGARTSAFGIDPEVSIAIDVTFSSDNPGNDNTKAVPCKLGAGPGIYRGPNINPIVAKLLEETAKKKKIPHQPLPAPGLLGNDANAIQVSRAGVAAGSLGIPNRYMHTQVETVSLADLESSSTLLANFCAAINKKTSFIPV